MCAIVVLFYYFREGGGEREKRRSTYSCIHWLPPVCALIWGQTHNLLMNGKTLQPAESPGQDRGVYVYCDMLPRL